MSHQTFTSLYTETDHNLESAGLVITNITKNSAQSYSIILVWHKATLMLKGTVSLTPASPDNPMHIPATFSDPAEHFNLLLCFGLGFFFHRITSQLD